MSDNPYNPDYEYAEALLKDGRAYFYIDEVGFYGFLVTGHLFTRRKTATVATVWIRPEYRNTFRAGRFIAGMMRTAKERGAEVVSLCVPETSPLLDSWKKHFGAPSDLVFVREL